MIRTTVINIHWKEPYDVYIGRKGKGQDGYFGNPFILERDGDRAQVLELYRRYFYDRLRTDPEFKKRVQALRGKVLACFCSPKECHGDVIAEYLNTDLTRE